MINIHTHSASGNPDVIEIVNRYPEDATDGLRFFSTGIHPWRIQKDRIEEELAIIERRLSLAGCVAVGECGLDKRIEIPMELQAAVFERHLEMAEKYRKPVILHCVAAYQEMIQAKKRLGITVPLVIHGFSKNIQVANSLIDNGFFLSFGKYLLRNPELKSVFRDIPNGRIFLETDTGEEGILAVYQKATEAKELTIGEIDAIVRRNFASVFGPFAK